MEVYERWLDLGFRVRRDKVCICKVCVGGGCVGMQDLWVIGDG